MADKQTSSAKKSTAKKPAAAKKSAPRKSAANKASKVSTRAKEAAPAAKKSSPKRVASDSAVGNRAESASRSRFFLRSMSRSRRLLKDNDGLLDLAANAESMSQRFKSGPLKELKALLRLIRAYVKGDYRDVSWESMVLIVAAVVYVVSPIDAIPDPLPVVGLTDDAAVLAFVLNLVRGEVDEFMKWEARSSR